MEHPINNEPETQVDLNNEITEITKDHGNLISNNANCIEKNDISNE